MFQAAYKPRNCKKNMCSLVSKPPGTSVNKKCPWITGSEEVDPTEKSFFYLSRLHCYLKDWNLYYTGLKVLRQKGKPQLKWTVCHLQARTCHHHSCSLGHCGRGEVGRGGVACAPSHHGEWKLLTILERTCLKLSTVRFYLVLYLILFSFYTVCEYRTFALKDYSLFTILCKRKELGF